MAKGNFNIRIPSSALDDELEALVVLLNMVSEEMNEAIFQWGYVNTHKSHHFSTQFSLVLDSNLCITNLTTAAVALLGYGSSELVNKPLSVFLTAESIEKVRAAHQLLHPSSCNQTHATLHFVTKDNLFLLVNCTLLSLCHDSAILLNGVNSLPETAVFDLLVTDQEPENAKQIKSRQLDAVLLQRLYDYILHHLDEPLPPLKALSKLFSTNEYKLKDGFRYFFNTSIYQFYNEERLKRSHLMVTESSIPLKNIAYLNGFSDYSNFSKSFKKRFGYSPNELKRSKPVRYLPLRGSC
ncbi:helix-turn-helix domain-containing protein [Flavobacterium sp. TMP13]|uniref:helix-turn-helix domain-containing protein n=1 Tax=Flavobacterium sp. TMP13 TaxID=3425950 RepID=UPI003D76B3C8